MSEPDLIEAFHDCIERLNAGQSIAACLQAHPQQTDALAPLLATGQLVQQASSVTDEVVAAQQRGRQRLEAALARQQPVPARRRWWSWPVWRSGWAFRLATAVLLLIFLVGGTAVMVTAAADSLPGDRLYAVKQQSEQLQLWLSGHDPVLAATFEQRRRDETRALLDLGRAANVTFRGRVQVVDETTWLVDGLSLTVSDQVARPGSLVEVNARTTGDGRLLAITVRPLTPDDALPPPATPTTPPPRPTDGATATATPTRPQATVPVITSTPTPTATAVSSPTPRPTQTAAETPRPTDTRPPATLRPSETPTRAEPTEERPSATATPQPTEERPTATATSERERP